MCVCLGVSVCACCGAAIFSFRFCYLPFPYPFSSVIVAVFFVPLSTADHLLLSLSLLRVSGILRELFLKKPY